LKLPIDRKATPWFRIAGLPLLLVAMAAPLVAGTTATPQPSPPADAGTMREAIQVLMISSMKKALELTRDQEQEVVPRVEQVFEEREKYAMQRRQALQVLQARLAEESVAEKDFRDGVAHLDDLERLHRDLELRLRSEIDRSLNARQRAQLRLFVPRFRKQMQMRIDEARRQRSRGLNLPQAPPPPGIEDYDQDDEEF
jgi:hypothetical protein